MPEVPQLPQQIPTYIPELLLSFYGELVYLNRLSSLQNCAVVNQDTIGAFQQLFDHMSQGVGPETYMSDGMQIGLSLTRAVSTCSGATLSELHALNSWFARVAGSKQAMVDTATPNVHKHAQEIQEHVMEVWATFFKFDAPKKTGVAIAKTAYWALGPVDQNAIL